ncbi:MAG TPA: hypothetical protein VIQ74_04115 [Gemmatimonadaceae bacterium]|jgi:hypothetical protein
MTRSSAAKGPEAYRLGRLPFVFSGSGACADYLRDELASLRELATGDASPVAPLLAFHFVDALPPLADYTATRPVYATEGSFRVAYNGLTYDVGCPDHAGGAESATAALRVAVCAEDRGRRYRLLPAFYRACDWNYLSVDEIHGKDFMYGVFDYLTHITQLSLGQSYIHASSLERDGQGTALVAWGGIGKTSAALKLITEHGFRFLSDDLGLVDDAGTIWRTPKRLQVYAYNLAGEERLRSMLLSGRSVLDRASWAWHLGRHGPKRARRRVSAEELFGSASVACSAPLARAYCLERGDARDFEATRISTEEMCRRAAEVVMHEIEPFGLLSRALHSGHHHPILPTQDQVVDATRTVLERAFRGVPVWSIRIPLAAPPSALAGYLLRIFDRAE